MEPTANGVRPHFIRLTTDARQEWERIFGQLTADHPCPLLRDGDFAKAKGTYDKCVDLLASVPNSKPVAFRMPCCDSLNTPSPRFYAEIFNKTTEKGNFLTIDTSVFNIFASEDRPLAIRFRLRFFSFG